MKLDATQFIDSKGRIVESAALLGAAAISALGHEPTLRISFAGLRGVSSSYFNMLLLTIARAHGADAIKSRVSFEFGSAVEQQIFQRSLDAVLMSIA